MTGHDITLTDSEAARPGAAPRTIAVLPTYNERDNIATLIAGLRAQDVEVLVADDDSPDETWRLVGEMSEKDPGVHLLHRKNVERGRGVAGAEGFALALKMGAARIVEMDADLSHRPEDLPRLFEEIERRAHVVIGSRFAPGGVDERTSVFRRVLTLVSNAWARAVLGVPVRDCNSGYRVYTAYAMTLIEPATLTAQGPSVVHETLIRAHRRGLTIREAPIRFVDRDKGRSQLSFARLLDGWLAVLRYRRRASRGTLWSGDARA
ncbi:glycosyltransferase [bacterium]|nr:glycosyltransferase [bacterium]